MHIYCDVQVFIIKFMGLQVEMTEAVAQKCSWQKVFWKYAANLQENTHAKVWFQ